MLQDWSPFRGATDIPVLDFWWRLTWVSKPGWIPRLCALSPAGNGFLRFTSETTPVDLLILVIAYVQIQSLLGHELSIQCVTDVKHNQTWSLSAPFLVMQAKAFTSVDSVGHASHVLKRGSIFNVTLLLCRSKSAMLIGKFLISNRSNPLLCSPLTNTCNKNVIERNSTHWNNGNRGYSFRTSKYK